MAIKDAEPEECSARGGFPERGRRNVRQAMGALWVVSYGAEMPRQRPWWRVIQPGPGFRRWDGSSSELSSKEGSTESGRKLESPCTHSKQEDEDVGHLGRQQGQSPGKIDHPCNTSKSSIASPLLWHIALASFATLHWHLTKRQKWSLVYHQRDNITLKWLCWPCNQLSFL